MRRILLSLTLLLVCSLPLVADGQAPQTVVQWVDQNTTPPTPHELCRQNPDTTWQRGTVYQSLTCRQWLHILQGAYMHERRRHQIITVDQIGEQILLCWTHDPCQAQIANFTLEQQ